MTWMKATPAAVYAGGISTKVLYTAVQNGDLTAARIGAGRNLLFSAIWLDEWLEGDATTPLQRDTGGSQGSA